MRSAQHIIETLGLEPHPEGGHYREAFRDGRMIGGRAASTAIYFLLAEGEQSRWHRVDAVEIWHFYAGAPLELRIAEPNGAAWGVILGAELGKGERPQVVVPAGAWQTARSLGAYTLAGCTVAPGFEFAGFQLAPDGWEPGAV
jgi:predicted cupin superfamily sugar epimerase